MPATSRKRRATDATSMRSGKTSASKYVAGGKGIHRPLGAASDAISMKSGYSAKTAKSGKSATASAHTGSEYTTKKAKGDMKKKGKPDPFAYIPLSRNTLNKRYVFFIVSTTFCFTFIYIFAFFFIENAQNMQAHLKT